MFAEWPGSGKARFIIVSVLSESPVGIASYSYTAWLYFRLWQRRENKRLFCCFLFLLVTLSPFSYSLSYFLFSVITIIFCSPAPPPLIEDDDSSLAIAYRNRTYSNKGGRDDKLSKDQHGAQLKENKKLQISKKKCLPTSAYQKTGSLSCKSRLQTK